MIDEQMMQQKYIEMEIIKQQMTQLNQQKAEVNARIMEASTARQCLEDLSEAKGKPETFVPIGAGISVDATINDTKKVLMNIGGGMSVKKDMKDAVESIGKTENGLAKQLNDIDNTLSLFEKQSMDIAAEFEKMQNEAAKAQEKMKK